MYLQIEGSSVIIVKLVSNGSSVIVGGIPKSPLLICILFICGISHGCAPFKDIADDVSDEFGEMSDDIGKKRVIGDEDSGIVVHPQGEKKVKMEF